MTEKSLASVFLNKVPDLRINKNNTFSAGRHPVTPQILWKLAKQYKFTADLFDITPDAYLIDSNTTFASSVCDALENLLRQKQTNEGEETYAADQEKLFHTFFNTSIRAPLSDLLFIELVDHDKKWIVYDEIHDISYPYAFNVIESTLRRLIKNKKLYADFIDQRLRQCRKVYSPLDDRFLEDEGGHVCYNFYNKPQWMKDWTPSEKVTALPEKTEFFLNHLANHSKEDRNMLLSFARDTVFSRAKYILILRGAAGCGKNMFIENMLANLVGCNSTSSNYYKTSRTFLESAFHGAITRHQLVFADEVAITESRSETLKDWHNEMGTGEDKYVTTNGPVRLRCSIVCATNFKRNVFVRAGDRKYLVPTLNDTDIKRATSQEWIDSLIEEWKDPEVLRQIASYLYRRVEEQKTFDVKTPQFLELCWISNPEYLKKFLHLATTQRTIREREFRKIYRSSDKRGLTMDTLRDQFEEYIIGHRVAKDDGGTWELDDKLEWVFKSNLVGRVDLVYQTNGKGKDSESRARSAASIKDDNVIVFQA